MWIDKTAFEPSLPFANVRLLTWGAPSRGDIVTFVPPHTDELHIKRVIGLPGDEIFFAGRDIHVNGSRSWGFVDETRIMGRVSRIAVSFASERRLHERFARPVL